MFFNPAFLTAVSLCASLQVHYPPIFPLLLLPAKRPSNQRGCLALVHLFQHDRCVSKKDLFDTNELSLLRSLLHIGLYLTFIPLLLLQYIIYPQFIICPLDNSTWSVNLLSLSSCLFSACLKAVKSWEHFPPKISAHQLLGRFTMHCQ